jgi:hypothetical protein
MVTSIVFDRLPTLVKVQFGEELAHGLEENLWVGARAHGSTRGKPVTRLLGATVLRHGGANQSIDLTPT